MTKISGIFAASMSVLNSDLSLNIEKTINHAEKLIDQGCHGTAIFGSTGQAQLIPISEKIKLLNNLSESKYKDKYLIGTGLNSLNETINFMKIATSLSFKNFLIIFLFFFISFELFANEKLKVVTTFTIISDITKNITGDAADVVSITKPGAEIHGYQPTPKDLVKAYDADLILWNGMNLELWFEQFFSSLNDDVPSIIVSKGITDINIKSGDYKGKPNPHAWMGLNEALIYIDNIVDALSKYDNQNKELYSKNAYEYKQKIILTIEPLKKKILNIPLKHRWLVTCEGAFSYLARDLRLEELYIWPMNADEVGTPKQIKNVIDKIEENEITNYFFSEKY